MYKENKMGTMPVNKLLLNMSLPMMISMLVQALYNIVDSIFVSQIDEYALRAVSLAFPLQMLMVAVAVGTSVGVNAYLSKTLGEKNYERSNHIAGNGIFLAIVSAVIFVLIGQFAVKSFYQSQTDVEIVRQYGISYLTICLTFSIGSFSQIILERILQSTGKTVHTMITQTTGAVINLILDPILIFGYFGFPRLGVAGAAYATVAGQIIAAIFALILNLCCNQEVKLSFRQLMPDFKLIAQIYKVGAPSIIMQSVGSVMTYGMNLILAPFGVAQTVFGIYFKLQSFIFMPVFGLNNGMVSIIAFNYGAGFRERVTETIRASIKYAVAIMLVGMVVFELFPAAFVNMFNSKGSAELLAIGVPALRIICTHFILAGFCIVVGSVFQALGNGVYSMLVSISRQLIVLLPAAYLLSLSGNVNLIWLSFPIAEVASVAMSTFFLIRINRKVIQHIGEPALDKK